MRIDSGWLSELLLDDENVEFYFDFNTSMLQITVQKYVGPWLCATIKYLDFYRIRIQQGEIVQSTVEQALDEVRRQA